MHYVFADASDSVMDRIIRDGRYRLKFVGMDADGKEAYVPTIRATRACTVMQRMGFGVEFATTKDSHDRMTFIVSPDNLPPRWAKAPDLTMRHTFPATMKRCGYVAACQLKDTSAGIKWHVTLYADPAAFERVCCG